MLSRKYNSLYRLEEELLRKYHSVENNGTVINKTVRMNSSVAKKLKIATKLGRMTQGEMIEALVDDFIKSFQQDAHLIEAIESGKEELYRV